MPLFTMVLTLCVVLGSNPALAAPSDAAIQPKLAGVRVPFLANEGQVDARVAYYAPTFAGTVFVTRQGEMVYALDGRTTGRETSRARPAAVRGPGWALTETLAGGRPQPAAGAPAQGRASFFLGADPARHRPDRPTYESIGLGEVWPGVTVTLHAAGQSVEKLFTVRPGASPAVIRVRVNGADALRLTGEGALLAQTGLGEVTFTAPIAYQEADGVRQPVPVAYRLHGREYGFALGAYDTARPVVIDPLLQSTFLGGSGTDTVNALAIHPTTGDVYVAGFTSSTTFPGTVGGAQPGNAGGTLDAFVARLNSTLTTILQSTFLGGTGFDTVAALAIDRTSGDVYVAGSTSSTTFPGTAGGAQASHGGGPLDAFVSRLNRTLTTLVQSTFLGGIDLDTGNALTIHPTSGDVYVAGDTSSVNFPGTAGGAQPTFGGGISAAFVARLSNSLTTLLQSTYFGSIGATHGIALAIAPTGDVYIGGDQTLSMLGNSTAYVNRYNSALTTLAQTSFLGGAGNEAVTALAIHPTTGDVYATGSTDSPTFSGTAGGAQPTSGGGTEAFVSRLNSTLTTLLQSTFLGGSGNDFGTAITVAPATGDVYVTGLTSSTNFPRTAGGAQGTYGGGSFDAFVSRLNSTLTTIVQSTFLGGIGTDRGNAVAIHPTSGDVYVGGGTGSGVFPGTTGGAQPTFGGADDGFVARLTADLTGPAASATIPTLSEWAHLVMVALLVLGGLLALRRRVS